MHFDGTLILLYFIEMLLRTVSTDCKLHFNNMYNSSLYISEVKHPWKIECQITMVPKVYATKYKLYTKIHINDCVVYNLSCTYKIHFVSHVP